MEIAVARVKNVGNAQTVLLAKARNFAHNLMKSRAGNHPVLDNIVRRDVANRGEGGFAAFPDEGALGIGLRDADFPRAIRTADFVDVSD